MIRLLFTAVTVSVMVLTGCTAKVENDEYVSKDVVLEQAKEIETSPHVVEWKAEIVKDKEIRTRNNTTERRTVWVVEAIYPAGNRTVIIFDAKTGEGLALKELEPNK
ncbi:hypothetical protein GCM10008967_28700 [Bacillus carboniphilus]|uniref:PepSY domain-containing protein n=1 Tax=Bacillus carboniphilus TaxID=86663 RepID=A0ABP3G6W4_9BACI